ARDVAFLRQRIDRVAQRPECIRAGASNGEGPIGGELNQDRIAGQSALDFRQRRIARGGAKFDAAGADGRLQLLDVTAQRRDPRLLLVRRHTAQNELGQSSLSVREIAEELTILFIETPSKRSNLIRHGVQRPTLALHDIQQGESASGYLVRRGPEVERDRDVGLIYQLAKIESAVLLGSGRENQTERFLPQSGALRQPLACRGVV